MIIFKEIAALKAHLNTVIHTKSTIGFVPTMGALHEGHLSLIKTSKAACDVTVCSIFVNPSQFNDVKDFEKYPITTEKDIQLLIKEGTDILFLPSVDEIYPAGYIDEKHYELGYLETVLEGAYRPGHFQGVCMVVHRLLNIVEPHKMFLGQKDFQQCMVLKKLVEISGISTEIIICDTIREASGLAMSSRNVRLNKDEKQKATAIYKSLIYIKENIKLKTAGELTDAAKQNLVNGGFEKTDYFVIADANTLIPIPSATLAPQNSVALAAAFISGVRLIDNMILYDKK